jgi:hypothetical protein
MGRSCSSKDTIYHVTLLPNEVSPNLRQKICHFIVFHDRSKTNEHSGVG